MFAKGYDGSLLYYKITASQPLNMVHNTDSKLLKERSLYVKVKAIVHFSRIYHIVGGVAEFNWNKPNWNLFTTSTKYILERKCIFPKEAMGMMKE